MASQAAGLSNHYEVLGISPTASRDEIGVAFERALGNFARPLSTTLHIYQAFEVLRQPDKRREYDRSIGLAPPPGPPQFLIRSQARAPFAVAARATESADHERELEPAVLPLEADVAAEPRKAADPALDELVDSILAEGRAEKAALRDAQRRPQDWRRIGIAAGVLMIGASVFGGLAGVSASGPATGEAAVGAPRPSPSPYLAGSAPSAELGVNDEAPAGDEEPAAPATERKINPLVIPPEVEAALAERANPIPAAEAASPAEPASAPSVDPLAPEPAPTATETAAAELPLPKATIARTIQKIGYPCAGVSSVAPVNGGGVFKVTCATGHSYRAAPVAGRYRFKKWSGA